MSGQIDEISHSIGGLETSLRSLDKTFTQHCLDDTARHQENVDTLSEIKADIAEIKKAVASLQATRGRALWLGIAVLTFIGWIGEQVISNAIKWLFTSH